MSQGTFTAADIDQTPPPQVGKFTAADLDGAPDAPRQGFWDKVQAKLPGSADTGLKGAVNHIQDTLDFLKSAYDVSAPGIAQQIYKKLSGQPNELKQLPGKMVTAFALGAEPEMEGAVGAGAPRPQIAPEAAAPEAAGSGVLSRTLEVAKRRIGNIPGVQAARDIGYIAKGAPEAAAAPTPAPAVPDYFGKGRYGTPIDQWGQRIQQPPMANPGQAGSMTQSVSQPPITRAVVGQQLNDALGGKPLQPNVPLRAQVPTSSPASSVKLPAGFTAVDSSALRGFKYDPAAREFETITPAGQHYIYGDVAPEDAQAFMDADSKGRAWQDIRQNPLVAKVINGKRIAMKPAVGKLSNLLEAQ